MRKTIILIIALALTTAALAVQNPAMENCIGNGNTYETKTDTAGNQYGVCNR